jgi:hypothetical protein
MLYSTSQMLLMQSDVASWFSHPGVHVTDGTKLLFCLVDGQV